ncbi:general secretion pathway protein GspK [Planctomicrobium sp. SH661]|uniref:general secretion pathway protein GspK n=1 Tax=Planctomicrobium sp. SH661 TaxID=3448124 RepID=UPI003F5B32B9
MMTSPHTSLRHIAPSATSKKEAGSRSGSALILVLVVIAMLSLGAYTYSELMITEYRAASAAGHQHAVTVWADSGVEYVAALLTPEVGGWDLDLYNNPQLFHVPVQEGGGFTVIAPLEETSDAAVLRMGVIDESGRINLNAIARLDPETGMARTLLMGLPNMTEEIADSILDWIDADQDPREYGAEAESDTLVPPRDGPLQSIEELLLINGVTAQLLYGEDANRNGVLDPNENDGDLSLPADNADGVLDIGWSEFFTLHSKESNLQHSSEYFGEPRLNVNETLLTDLYDLLEERLGPDEARFITAYRLNGPLKSGGDQSSGQSSGNSSSGGGSSSGSAGGGPSSSGGSQGGSPGTGSSSPGTSGGTSGGSGSSTGSSGRSSSGGGSTSAGSSGGTGGSVAGGGGSSTGSSRSGGSRSRGLSLSTSGGSNTSSTGNSETDEALKGMANGLASIMGGTEGAVTRGGMDVSSGGSTTIESIYELIGSQVQVTIDGQETVLDSPWKADAGSLQQSLPELLDTLTFTTDEQIEGRININQARREVLVGIPGMPEDLPDAILSARAQRLSNGSGSAERFNTAGWLLIDGLVDLETMRLLDSSITGRGDVIRVQVVGHGDSPGPMARVEAIIDGTTPVPSVISYRNLSDLGAGFRRDQLPSFSDSPDTPNNR